MKKDNSKVEIRFPSLWLMPLLALIGAILKVCNATSADWLFVLLIAPVSVYFIWCVGYCFLAMMAIWIYKLVKGNKE